MGSLVRNLAAAIEPARYERKEMRAFESTDAIELLKRQKVAIYKQCSLSEDSEYLHPRAESPCQTGADCHNPCDFIAPEPSLAGDRPIGIHNMRGSAFYGDARVF